MTEFKTILKWILIVLFFPFSLLFIAYFRQKKAGQEYFKDEENDL